jgi:hypothetical protein
VALAVQYSADLHCAACGAGRALAARKARLRAGTVACIVLLIRREAAGWADNAQHVKPSHTQHGAMECSERMPPLQADPVLSPEGTGHGGLVHLRTRQLK